VLILLLVYHFKQRLSALENKCDTVFEIISNVVQELSSVKNMAMTMNTNPCNTMCLHNPYTNNNMPSFQVNGKIKVSDEEFEDEEEEEDEDEEEEEDEDEDEEDEDEEEPLDNSGIRIINVDIGEVIESDILETEIESENVDPDTEENDKLEPVELDEEETPTQVEKLEETSSTVVESKDTKEDVKEVYSKMSLNALKTLVITKGLCSDASKLKKNELLKLLEA